MPKIVKPLTKTKLDTARPDPNREITLHDGQGLYLLVAPSGAKLWRFRYQAPDGRRRLMSFGDYFRVTLEEARKCRAEALSHLKAGRDPQDARKPLPAPSSALYGDIAARWLEAQRPGWSEIHSYDYARKLDLYVLPYLGDLHIKDVDIAAIQAVLDPLAAAGKHETLKKVKGIISAVLQYAPPGLGVIDWTRQIGRKHYPAPTVQNRAAITRPDEIAGLLKAIISYRSHGLITALAMKFSALTFARPGEIRHAEWTEIDETERLWRIPAAKMKGKRPHLVPLAPQTLAVIEELRPTTGRSKYLFPSTRTIDRPMSEVTVLAAIRRLGYSKSDMSAHGFRGMASSVLNERGWNRDWIERQLAHIEGNSVRAAYNHTDYLDGRRKMMDWWANYLEALEIDTPPPPISTT